MLYENGCVKELKISYIGGGSRGWAWTLMNDLKKATDLSGTVYLYDIDFKGPCAIVMGSEGNGVSQLVKKTCDGVVSIPMYGKVNSFNVSTAAAIILAEAAKQHRS